LKKILIHSNAPTVATGYGVQCRHLANELCAAGYEVAVSATWGQQGRISDWQASNGDLVRVYPMGFENQSLDMLVGHADHWFEGDPDAGIIILLLDVWVLNSRKLLLETLNEYTVVAWTPVDHDPAPPQVLEAVAGCGAHTVAMSKFGQDRIQRSGIAAEYVPLSVDTSVYQPTFEYAGETSRQFFGLPDDAFVVGMVAMNKDGGNDRKGFDEAFQAFARFWRTHPAAVLFVHTEKHGMAGGADLPRMAAYAGIPPHALKFTDQYAYRLGFPPGAMAAAYTAMDVLLAPSRGEGFCVPMVEAQACGTPVIASKFAAQTELVGNGWLVIGQKSFDIAQSSYWQTPYISDVADALAEAYAALENNADDYQAECVEHAAQYDTGRVFDEFWQPYLERFEPAPPTLKDRMESVDIVVPLMRPDKLERLAESVNEPRARMIVVHDTTNPPNLTAFRDWRYVATGETHTTYAEKVNAAMEVSTADWVLVIGDDVEFTPGWFDAAADESELADIIGTNDSEDGRVRNPHVAAGTHADHFFIRRSYIDDEGASLDGPGVAMPTAYRHWFVDKEVIGLARARGVYRHAHNCRIIHHHPGYDGDETAREADPAYMAAVASSKDDEATWAQRRPLLAMHQVSR
jgi:glycosyltransferase involved in cell wall biosynthesis